MHSLNHALPNGAHAMNTELAAIVAAARLAQTMLARHFG